jgi:hypothetical protein
MGSAVDTDQRIDRLEQRISQLEDQIAIYQLLATYGPSADSGSDDVVRDLYTVDGTYDSGLEAFAGADAVGDMIASLPLHRQVMAEGSSHVVTMPVVRIEGDRAYAVCHGQLQRFDKEADQFRIWRSSGVQLEFLRTPQGWRFARRSNRLLDGSPESHAHLRAGLRSVGAIPADQPAAAPVRTATVD